MPLTKFCQLMKVTGFHFASFGAMGGDYKRIIAEGAMGRVYLR
jgi:hypothetical protein